MEYVRLGQNIAVIYFWIINLFLLFLLIAGMISILTQAKKIDSQRLGVIHQTEGLPTISIIVPCYNEEVSIVVSTQALLNLSYRKKTVIIANDGSTDNSLEILKNTFHLTHVHKAYPEGVWTEKVRGYYHSLTHPNLIVVDKENGGRSDALNCAFNAANSDYVVVIDADTLIDTQEMDRLMRYIFVNSNIEGFGATVRVVNGSTVDMGRITHYDFPKTFLGSVQAIEYLRAFYLGRLGFNCIQGPLCLSGAFSIWQTETLRDVGGFYHYTIGEDMELVMNFKKKRYEQKKSPMTRYIAEPVCWTEVPESWSILGKQRTRWHIGLIQNLWRYKKLMFNPKYGYYGMIGIPYYIFAEMLPPIVEALGYIFIILLWIFGYFSPVSFIPFFLVTWGLTFVINIFCCLVEVWVFKKYNTMRHVFKMVAYSLLENIGYRQVTVWWRLKAFPKVFKKYSGWKDMLRTGFTAKDVEGERGGK